MHMFLTFSGLLVLKSSRAVFALVHNFVTKFRKKLETCKQFAFYQEDDRRNIPQYD